MPADLSKPFNDRLAALRERFLLRAADDLAALLANPPERADPEAVRFLAHRLAGAAATFGFPAVSAAASALCAHVADPSAHAALVAELRALPTPFTSAEGKDRS